MSRRLAARFSATVLAGALMLWLPGCGRGNEAQAPPQDAVKAPVEAEQPAPGPAPTEAKVEAPARTYTAPPPPAPAPSPAPEFTPGRVVRDAVPPVPAADADAKPKEQPADALKWLADNEARRVDYQKRLTEAEANLAVANASLADWERTSLAYKNPYLARPKLAAEDAQTVTGMDGSQRSTWAQGRLEAARVARDQAQKVLDDLKANPPPD